MRKPPWVTHPEAIKTILAFGLQEGDEIKTAPCPADPGHNAYHHEDKRYYGRVLSIKSFKIQSSFPLRCSVVNERSYKKRYPTSESRDHVFCPCSIVAWRRPARKPKERS